MSDLSHVNPVSAEAGDQWVRSAAGGQARDRVLARADVEVTAEQHVEAPRSTASVLVAAALMVLVAATLVFAGPGDGKPVAGGVCPVTIPEPPFLVPPPGFPAAPPDLYEAAWYGTADLFTMIGFGGKEFAATGDKLVFWSEGFSSASDDYYEPELTVTATRIGSAGAPRTVTASRANNGSRGDIGTFMITGMVLDPGCWKITAAYRGTELSYVVSVPEG